MENTEQKERIDNMKRTMAILLALIMVFALAAPVMASETARSRSMVQSSIRPIVFTVSSIWKATIRQKEPTVRLLTR